MESRIHGDMYVRFGGRYLETYHRKVARRQISSLLMHHCQKNNYDLPVFCTFDRVAGLNYVKDKQGAKQQAKDGKGETLPQVSIKKGEKSFPVFITTFSCVHALTKERIKYDDYKQLTEEERKEYNVYHKLQVYSVLNKIFGN